jgi:hypothetical protein
VVPAGGTWNDEATTVEEPLRTRLTRDTEGVFTPQPWITVLRNHADAASIHDPLATVATGTEHGGGHQALTVPPGAFIQKHHGGLSYRAIEHMTKPVTDPMPGVVARPNLSHVIPYRRGKAKTTDEPLHTLATHDSAALLAAATIDIDDCRFRMLKPREHGRAQCFPDSYRHQPWTDGGFAGISVYDTAADPYHATLVRRVALPGGIHTVQLDPEVESGRPYAYANAFEFGTEAVFIVNFLTGAVVGTYQSPEPQGCYPSDEDCQQFNSPMTHGCSEALPAACSTTSPTGTAACGSWT